MTPFSPGPEEKENKLMMDGDWRKIKRDWRGKTEYHLWERVCWE